MWWWFYLINKIKILVNERKVLFYLEMELLGYKRYKISIALDIPKF